MKTIKSKEELMAMSHEKLVEYACELQVDSQCYQMANEKNKKLNDILKAIGLVYKNYSDYLKQY